MTDEQIGTGVAQAPAASAPVEQQSTETQLTSREQRRAERSLPSTPGMEPQNPLGSIETEGVTKPKEISTEDKANDAARQALRDRMRADDAERRLKEMTPKAEIPDKQPDINDPMTWGKKYQNMSAEQLKDANVLENFLKARDEWSEAQGERKATERQKQGETAKALEKQRLDVATRDQAARGKYKDYDAVITPIIPILASNGLLKDFVTKNAMGSEVAYELGRNPAVLQTLLQNPDIWAVGEQLLSMAARLKAPKPVEITKAPEPITPVGSRETARVNLPQLASKDTGAYMAEMNKRELKKKFGRHVN